MKIPTLTRISRKEFDLADNIYKIISDEFTNTHYSFILNNKKYYVGYSSSDIIEVKCLVLKDQEILLVCVDLKVVGLCTKDGRIVFALGLSSYFMGFEETDSLNFVICCQSANLTVGKYYLNVHNISHIHPDLYT